MATTKSAFLHRSLKEFPAQVVEAKDKTLVFSDGTKVLDSTCGAAVACIGYNNDLSERVKQAMIRQMDKFPYCNSFFGHEVGEQLAQELMDGTGGAMSKAYIVNSGRALFFSSFFLFFLRLVTYTV